MLGGILEVREILFEFAFVFWGGECVHDFEPFGDVVIRFFFLRLGVKIFRNLEVVVWLDWSFFGEDLLGWWLEQMRGAFLRLD